MLASDPDCIPTLPINVGSCNLLWLLPLSKGGFSLRGVGGSIKEVKVTW